MAYEEDHDTTERDAKLRLGTQVAGKWTLEAIVGLGGMGAVYRATHRNGSVQAIKIMHKELLSNSKHIARFFREAEYANRVGHPAVLRVFDDGEHTDGCPYMVTELLSGQTLEEERIARGGRLPVAEVVKIGLTICDVLDKAHAVGLLHRDLKPVNLFRTDKGELRVLDFGLGRDFAEDKGGGPKLTSAFVVMGTVGFMAPEQAKGKREDLGPHTDLWALGATLLMLATGLEAHEADSPMEALGLAAVRPVEKTGARCNLLPAFCASLDKAMEFKPKDRFADARSMRASLETVHDALGPSVQTREFASGSLPQIGRHSVGRNAVAGNSMLGVTSDATAHSQFDLEEGETLFTAKPQKKAEWSIRTKRAITVGAVSGALALAILGVGASVLLGNKPSGGTNGGGGGASAPVKPIAATAPVTPVTQVNPLVTVAAHVPTAEPLNTVTAVQSAIEFPDPPPSVSTPKQPGWRPPPGVKPPPPDHPKTAATKASTAPTGKKDPLDKF
jgi:eukaryotic-like serine/threonine-protein kinase